MNLKSTSVFAGLIAGSALALSTLPAQAATPSPFTVGGVTFNTDGTFTIGNAPTTINFTFLESRGFYQSSFGIYDSGKKNLVQTLFTENAPGYDTIPVPSSDANGDWLGTCGITITPAPCKISYTFAQNTTYSFGLDSSPQGGLTFTETSGTYDEGIEPAPGNNPANPPYSAFNSNSKIYYRSTVGPGAGGGQFKPIDTSPFSFFTAINDTARIDADIQDFIVGGEIVGTTTTVPEPATLAGLGLVAGAMTMLRRRKGSQVS
jgi:hypothetical protein